MTNTFDTITDLIASTTISVGQTARTLGYYAAGDGGGNDYLVVAAGTGAADGGSYIDLTGISGQAQGIFDSHTTRPEQFGAIGDGTTDNQAIVQTILDLAETRNEQLVLQFGEGTYAFGATVAIPTNVVISGTGNTVFDITHNTGIGFDFAGTLGDRNRKNGLQGVTFRESGNRDDSHFLVRFQQIEDSFLRDVVFDSTPNSFFLFESLNTKIENVEFNATSNLDFKHGNAVDTFMRDVRHVGPVTPSGLTASELGDAYQATNGVSGLYVTNWQAVRKFRGFYFGNRSGATGRTPEHVFVNGIVADNCKDAGIDIEDLFNGYFDNYFVGYCGNIDQVDGDPNGERRRGISISAGSHPVVAATPSTQELTFSRNGYVFLSSREGLAILGSAESGRAAAPRNIAFHGRLGSSNNIDEAELGHILVGGSDVVGLNFDGVSFEAARPKTNAVRANNCIRFTGGLGNTDIRMTNMTFGDVSGSDLVAGDVTGNSGVVVSGNNQLVGSSWAPSLTFGGSSAGLTYSTRIGRLRRANGMVYVEGDLQLAAKGTASGSAVIDGLPFEPLGHAVGSIDFRSGGSNVSRNGLFVRTNTNGQLVILYQGITSSGNVTDASFTDTSRVHFSVTYAVAD